MSRDDQDALMEQLLREILGGDRPRDMTARIMTRAKAHDRSRRAWWAGAVSAVAAVIALAVTLWVLRPREYPSPQIDGDDVVFVNTSSVERGSHLETPEQGSAKVNLGGYVSLTMDPQTALTIGGTKFDEMVVLERGRLDVNVEKNKGKFAVAVGSAMVNVTGTKFHLDVADDGDESIGRHKQLNVTVDEGSVVVRGTGTGEPITLASGARQTFDISAEPMMRGNPQALSNANIPAPLRARAQGVMVGAQEGNRLGNRNGLLLRPNADGTAPANRAQPAVRGMQVVVAQGSYDILGTLRHDRELFFLQTPGGPVLLYPQQPPVAGWPPSPSLLATTVHVYWQNGKVVKIEPATTDRGGGTPSGQF